MPYTPQCSDVLSDPSGNAMNANASCGSVVITEEPVNPVVLSVGNGSASVGSSGTL